MTPIRARHLTHLAAAPLTLAGAIAVAQTPPPLEVVHTSVTGHPRSIAPGTSRVFVNTGFAVYTSGPHVAVGAGLFPLMGILQGSVLLRDGQLVAQDGDVLPGIGTSRQIQLTGMNAAGTLVAETLFGVSEFGFVGWPRGAPALAHYLAGDPCPLVPGSTWRFQAGSVATIDDLGRFGGFGSADLPGGGTTRGAYLDTSWIARVGQDPPAGQLGGTNDPWEGFFATSSGDGTVIGLTGSLAGSHDRVFAVQNAVVLQEGMPNPVGPGTLVQLRGVVDRHGRRMELVRSDAWTGDALLIDEELVVRVGDRVHPLASVDWSFIDYPTTNAAGDTVMVGRFLPGGFMENYVFVANGTTELLRSGDPVDLDGNGQYDDDAFVKDLFFHNSQARDALADDRTFYLNVRCVRGNGSPLPGNGAVLLRGDLDDYDLGTPECASVSNTTGDPARISATGSTSVAANALVLRAAPVPADQFGIFLYSPGAGQTPLGPGFLCVGGPFTRLSVESSSGARSIHHRLDLSFVGAAGPILPGSTMHFQCWFRDPAAATYDYNTSNGLAITFTP